MPSRRRGSSVVMAAVIAPAAVLFIAGGDAHRLATAPEVTPAVADVAPCCLEIVTPLIMAAPGASINQPSMNSVPGQMISASRWKVVAQDVMQALPVGVASESGLQVKTILAARAISAAFPEIHDIGGVRPDALRWHPNGLALDIMIPNPSSAEGKALGDEVLAFVLVNAGRFGLDHAIWRGTLYMPSGPRLVARSRGSGHGDHYDHVHISTTGGGYPTGGEIYLR